MKMSRAESRFKCLKSKDFSEAEFVFKFEGAGRSADLQRLPTPSDFHTPLPSIVPFAHPKISSTHSCIYPIFTVSSGTTSFFPFFMFPVDLNFCQSRSVHSLNMSASNELFSSYVIQYRILSVHFFLIYSFVFLSNL